MRTRSSAIIGMLLALAAAAAAEDPGWPREIDTGKGKLLIYQPQIDGFAKNVLEGRCAMSFTATGAKEPVFGSFWFKALLDTDFDTRVAELVSIQVPKVKFADATAEQQKTVSAFLEREIPKLDIPISIDRLSAAMAELSEQKKGTGDFKNDPPKIVISYEAAVLLFYDGEPLLRDIEGQKGVYQQAVNTPLPVLLDVKAKKFYLCGGDIWYTATKALGPWTPTTAVPEPLLAMKKEADKQQRAAPEEKKAEQKPTDEKPPRIVVATTPTELIVIYGEPGWSPIKDTDLLYVSNSLGNIFKDITTQKTYVLLSGRWYEAPSLNGPWAYVPPEKLPAGFTKIPEDSPAATVLASVPGTAAAMDALLDAQIPQTAAIKRSAATLEVAYDGAPKFKAIEGTKLEFAVNTSSSVIKLESKYYCCSQAVWYVAGAPQGPWQVADKVPDEIYAIPPSNPHHNTTNVYVFDSTPDVVYTGYYPGYVNSYIYGGCVVYGTGWYYPPYVSPHVYYPFVPTWGFGVGWNPWTGWSFGISWGYGPFRIGIGFGGYGGFYGGYHGWYGAPGFHPPYYGHYPGRPGVPPGHHPPGHYPGGPGGGSARPGGPSVSNPIAGGGAGAARPGGAQAAPRNTNLYASPQNSARNAQTSRNKSGQTANRAGGGANNVYASPNGDVFRRNSDGSWQQRQNGGWSKSGSGAGVGAQPSTGASAKSSNLNRDYQSRSRGSSRASSYSGSRGGMSRGGGGRRR